MFERTALRRAVLLFGVYLAIACTAPRPSITPAASAPRGSPVTPEPSSTNNVEPDAGAFRMTTAPSRAADEWRFLFRSDDGRKSREPEIFDTDDAVVVVQLQFPGIWQVILNDTACEGSFEIIGKLETQILVEVPETGGCFVTVTGSRQLP
jgi:hypothetical protein